MNKIFLPIVFGIIGMFALPTLSLAATFPEAGISTKIPVVGRIDNATQSWSGSLITNFDVGPDRTVNGTGHTQEMYFDNVNGSFSGFFVLTAACATMSCKDTSGNWDASAFVSFNHGAIGVPPATLISSIDPNIYAMSGFAWSKSSGWIAFNVGPDPVKYNRLTGLFSGFAWSKNLGYISMAGLKMVAQVPKLNLNPQNIVAANHSGTLDLLTSSGVIDGLDVYTLDINRWDSDDADTYANIPSLSGSFTDVDIRRVRISTDLLKVYNYKLNDPFGNSSTGALTVVANTPTSTMDPSGNTIGTGTVTGDPMKLLSTGPKKADGIESYDIQVRLHDRYGNKVESVSSVKNVSFTIAIENNIKPNQTGLDVGMMSNADPQELHTSLNFSGTTFDPTDLLSVADILNTYKGMHPTDNLYSYSFSGVGNDQHGQQDIKIQSYMPTDTGSNTLKLLSMKYRVDPLNGLNSIGEFGETTAISSTDLEFRKLWGGSFELHSSVGSFGINIPFTTDGSFSPTGAINGETAGVSYHLYKSSIGTGAITSIVSFSGVATNDIWEPLDVTDLNNQWRYIDRSNSTSFELIPKISSSLSSLPFDLEHKTVRKFQGGILGSEFAYNITGKTATGVTKNRGIKILGTASTSNMSSNNSGSIFALNSQDEYTKIGNFSKPQIRDTVRQNVATIIRNNNLSDVVIQNGDYILDNISNFPDNKHTLIVNGGNLTLKVDIPAATDGKPRAVIVLGGDMKLGPAVQTINASIFTDHGLIAESPSDKQLYIFGTLISGNTIGTSALIVNNVCPDFLPKPCSDVVQKQYDLNFLRTGPTSVVVTEYPEYPVVIRYNPKLTSDPPPGFKKMTR